MRQLAILIVLAGAGYLLYTQALPKYQEHKQATEAGAAEADQSQRCIGFARQANSSFASEIRQFAQPPVDQGLWATTLIDLSSQLSAADTACSCPSDACLTASAALLELRGLINDINTFVRTAGPPVMNAANRLETIDRLLESASKQ